MPKLQNKPLKIVELAKLDAEARTNAIAPILEAHSEQLTKMATSVAELANSHLFDAIKAITLLPKFPLIDIANSIKLPDMSAYMPNLIEPEMVSIGRYEPPVSIKKSDWEIEKEKREAYATELQIQILEQQLNLVKGLQTPQYDQVTGVISFMSKQIEIPLNTNLEMVCRIVLKNIANMKRKWSWEEIIEANRDEPSNFKPRQIYNASRSINEKVAMETQIKDLLILKPFTTVQLNPKYLAK